MILKALAATGKKAAKGSAAAGTHQGYHHAAFKATCDTHARERETEREREICIYMPTCICIYVCMHVYICIYTHARTHA